jgi:hypothetical protein
MLNLVCFTTIFVRRRAHLESTIRDGNCPWQACFIPAFLPGPAFLRIRGIVAIHVNATSAVEWPTWMDVELIIVAVVTFACLVYIAISILITVGEHTFGGVLIT